MRRRYDIIIRSRRQNRTPVRIRAAFRLGDRVNGLWIAGKIGARNSRFITVTSPCCTAWHAARTDLSDDRGSESDENVFETTRDRNCAMLSEFAVATARAAMPERNGCFWNCWYIGMTITTWRRGEITSFAMVNGRGDKNNCPMRSPRVQVSRRDDKPNRREKWRVRSRGNENAK